jgi:FMN phosphatase YigB (HAD superfamily)
VVFTKELGAPKPDPKGLRHALAALGVASEDAVYIGDHPALDVGAARAAGVFAARVLTGEHATLPTPPDLAPDLVATDLADALGKLGLLRPSGASA